MELFLLDAADLSQKEIDFVRCHFPKRYERACRMVNHEERLSVLASGILLARVLAVEDESCLTVSPEGRPSIKNGPDFSLSHSGGRCVLAVGKNRIGVDIEKLDPGNLIAAEAALTPEELAWIEPSPLERFHILWTRKESVFKAVGGYADPREIPCLDDQLPEGLFLSSIITEGFALSICSDEKADIINPIHINRILCKEI